MTTRAWCMFFVGLGVVACEDKARPKYDECVQLEGKGDVLAAASACEGAAKADPESQSGKAASAKRQEMQPEIDKVNAAVAAKKAEEERLAAIAQKERWKTMPSILKKKITETAKWDLGRGTSTPAIDVIVSEVGKPSASFEGSYGLFMSHAWGGTPAGTDFSEVKAMPFAVRIARNLACGDYTPPSIEFYSYGERLHP